MFILAMNKDMWKYGISLIFLLKKIYQKCNLEYERERWISYQDGIRNLQKQRTNDPTLKQKTNQKIYLIFNRGHPGQCDQIGWFIVLCNKWLGTLS